MSEPCNELKEMMFSRSFRLLKKYMDKKKKRREKKNAKSESLKSARILHFFFIVISTKNDIINMQ